MKDSFTKKDAKAFRDMCVNRAIELCNGKDAAIALSGGTDSITVLFSMLEAGIKPECYTFYMNGIISGDLQASRNVCKHFGLKLNEICIPWDDDTMYADVIRVIPYCEHIKKTIIQCMIPWLYIYPALKQSQLVNGLGADDFYGTNRHTQVAYSKLGDSGIISERLYHGNDLELADANIKRFARRYGKSNIDFYEKPDFEKFLLQYTFRAINKPIPKYPSIAAFADYYKKGAFYRGQENSSFQVNSRLRECQDQLLKSKYNTGCHKAIIGLYNDIARRVANGNG